MSVSRQSLTDVPDAELSESARRERDQFIASGYSARHLVLGPSGKVFFDPELCDADAHERVFHPGLAHPELAELVTARLRLIRPTLDDFPNLIRMHNDPRVSLWLGGPVSDDDGRSRHVRNLEHWQRHGFGWWIVRDRATDAFLGRGGLRHQRVNDRDEMELGYGFVPEAWGRGIATELARESVRVAFDVLGFRDLVCFTLPHNLASRRVMEKAGFTFEREGEWAGYPHIFYRL